MTQATDRDGVLRNPDVAHEPSDVNVRGVLGFAGGLAGVLVVVLGLLAWQFSALKKSEDAAKKSTYPLADNAESSLEERINRVPAPRLDGLPAEEARPGVASVQAGQEEAWLNGGGEDRGRRHIPIGRAMGLVAKERGGKSGEPRQDLGVPGTGGDSNSGRLIPEGAR